MRKADNLPPYSAAVKKSRSLNFLETSGSVQACYGTALLYYDHSVQAIRSSTIRTLELWTLCSNLALSMDVFLPHICVPVITYGQDISSGRDTVQGVQANVAQRGSENS